MQTLSTLSAVQIGRAVAFPAKVADNPVRAVALDGLQRRNAALDAVFYDVGVVTPQEMPCLAFWLAREGAILVVPPTGQGDLQLFLTPEAYFHDGGPVAALAVAGVGSSALGAAAFGRNVADALGQPVAAVVSGYGLADVLTEALGGFFLFGGLNSLRHLFEPLDALSKLFTRTESSSGGVAWARTSKDTETVIALLKDPRFSASLLVGHSKGNLVISEALYAIDAEDRLRFEVMAERLRIVTISAKIGMPPACRNVIDVMGAWDWFGALNSRPDIDSDFTVPHAWHSTNRDFPLNMGMDVARILTEVLPMFEAPRPASASAPAALAAVLDAPQRAAAALRTGA